MIRSKLARSNSGAIASPITTSACTPAASRSAFASSTSKATCQFQLHAHEADHASKTCQGGTAPTPDVESSLTSHG